MARAHGVCAETCLPSGWPACRVDDLLWKRGRSAQAVPSLGLVEAHEQGGGPTGGKGPRARLTAAKDGPRRVFSLRAHAAVSAPEAELGVSR